MTPERYAEIYERLSQPDLKINLSPNPTTMGPAYVGEQIAVILAAKSVVNNLSEEVERALVQAQVRFNDLEELSDAHFDVAMTTFEPDEVEGLDAKGRASMARQKVEQAYRAGVIEAALAEGQTPPTQIPPLRTAIKDTKNQVAQLKTLLNIIERRREEFNRLDSGVRLQLDTIKTETTLYPRGEAVQSSRGSNGHRTRETADDSVGGESSSGLVSSDDFSTLTRGSTEGSNPE